METIPGIVLAGGAGRRLGGDKALAMLGGRPLLAHVIARVAPQCVALAVNAAGDPGRLKGFGLPVLCDGMPEGLGPLSGILAAMDWGAVCGAERVLTVAVDTPFLPRDLVARLQTGGAGIVLAETADGVHGTTGLWPVALRGPLRAALESGTRKVTDWTAAQGARTVRFPDTHPPAFFNVNRPADLAQAEAWLCGLRAARGSRTTIMVDWSARSAPSPRKPSKDAIFIAEVTGGDSTVTYHRTRHDAVTHLEARFDAALSEGREVLAGFDFPFGYPEGFAHAVTGSTDPLALWAWLAARVEDARDNANNRLAVADAINAALPGGGPFWSHPTGATPAHVPFRKPSYAGLPFAERRRVEEVLKGASSCFQLYGSGAVASQALVGLPHLQRLRERFGDRIAVRPFEARAAPILLAEIYPSLLRVAIEQRRRDGEILDAAQVRVMAEAFAALPEDTLDAMLREGGAPEGWILGVGQVAALERALA